MDLLLLLRIAAALVGTGAAAWQDAKTSFIDDKITVSMIAVGAAFCLYEAALAVDKTPWIWAGVAALAIAVLGFALWKAGQFGGGDVLLFIGLQLLLPFNPTAAGAFLPYPFIVSVLVSASFLGSVWTAFWFAKRLSEEGALDAGKAAASVLGALAAVAVLAWFSLSLAQIVFFGALFASAFFLTVFKKEIMRRVVVKRVRLSEVEDEDVLAIDELPARLVARYKIGRVLTKSEVAKLRVVGRREKIVLWPVCKELPRFAPFVFAGLAACLVVGDVVLFVLTH